MCGDVTLSEEVPCHENPSQKYHQTARLSEHPVGTALPVYASVFPIGCLEINSTMWVQGMNSGLSS